MRSLPPMPLAMRTTVWVVGMLLLLPGPGYHCCQCLMSLANLCCDGASTEQCCAATAPHLHLSASQGSKSCPCQCRHQAPQPVAITSVCENRPADDVDYAVRLGACSRQLRCPLPAQDLFAVHHGATRAIPALALCATLSRFLL